MTATLVLVNEEFDLELAKFTIVGYCFHEVDSQWDPPEERFGDIPVATKRRLWGYGTYEGTRSDGNRLVLDDLLAPITLNVVRGFGVDLLSRLQVVAPAVSDEVAKVNQGFDFWHLDPNDVAPRSRPEQGSDSWHLHRAWFMINCVPGVGPTISHKILHHRWPNLFPIVDKWTLGALGREDYWGRILDDLRRDETQWNALERWFRDLPLRRDESVLTRLRLYDILLWCRLAEQEAMAVKAGKARMNRS